MPTLKTKIYIIIFALIISACSFGGTVLAAAAQSPAGSVPASSTTNNDPCHPENNNPPGKKLSSSELASCVACSKNNPTTAQLNNCLGKNPIVGDIKTMVNFLSAGVGIVVVGSIIVGAIQYIAAGNNPNAVGAAKQRITNALIALLAFFFIYAFLNWLIPGGLLFNL